RATGGREHTEVRALDPGRSSFSCLSLSLVYSLYNTITGRRKKVTRRESPKKCLTKPTGSEILRRAIDEYWERFEKKGRGKA
ncbi:MAG: hypothetical protein ABSG44_16515, partial [Thermodesulfobacteriota bacterium]